MTTSTGPIWRIGLFDRHVFRNGRVGALCMECSEMFWEIAAGVDQKTGMERGLKKHVVTTHREYGLKLLELMLDEEGEEEEERERGKDGECAKDTKTTASTASTEQSHCVEVNRQSSSAISSMPSEQIETKGQLKRKCLPPDSAEHSNQINERNELGKSLSSTQIDADGTSTSTECDASVFTRTPSISAHLLAAAQQLCSSLNNMSENAASADGKMPILTPYFHRVPKLSRIDDEKYSEQHTEPIAIELPELPERVFPIYVDEFSVPWHWLHAARNEQQAIGTCEMRLVNNESENRLFYECTIDQLCPFRAVWVRERSAVYQSQQGHNHRSLPQGSISGIDLITADDCPRPPLSPQRPMELSADTITDHSPKTHAQLPTDALTEIASPIAINVSGTHTVDLDQNGPTSSGSSKKSVEEWKFLAHVEPDESNLASICSQLGITRQSVLNSTMYGTTRYHYGCLRRREPFQCRFRAMFCRGQSSMYYRSAHNHSVPLSEMEMEWLGEWKAQRQKKSKTKKRHSKGATSRRFLSPPLKSVRQIVSDQQSNSTDQQKKKGQSSTKNNHSNGQYSSITSLQDFITYLENRSSTSQQNDGFHQHNSSLDYQQSKKADEMQQNGNGAIKQEQSEE